MHIFEYKKYNYLLNNELISSHLISIDLYKRNFENSLRIYKKKYLNLFNNQNLSKYKNETNQNIFKHSKEEIENYNKTRNYILNNYKDLDLSFNLIKDIHHRLLPNLDFNFRKNQEVIKAFDKNGDIILNVKTASFSQVEDYLANAIRELNSCFNNKNINLFIAIPIFILDFLKIHPFVDGNGRTSRILKELLLLKAGQEILIYSPIEKNIRNYESIRIYQSSENWENNENDYLYYIDMVLTELECCYIQIEKTLFNVDHKEKDDFNIF